MQESADEPEQGKRRKGRPRRARGTGSIFKTTRNGRTVWIGRKVVGSKIVERWAATQGEVIKKLAAVGPPSSTITVSAWVDRWKSTLQVRPRTEANYLDDMRRHIVPEIGHLQVVQVKPSTIESLAVSLRGKGLGTNSIRKALRHARILFSAAVRDGLIHKNPVSLARKPAVEKKEINPFTAVELANIIAAVSEPHEYPIALLAGTGCRGGEAVALDVADFDPDAGTIAITKSFHKTHGMGEPKSANSTRTIRVPLSVQPIIVKAIAGRTKGPLFLTLTGGRRSHELVHNAWKKLIARLGLKYRNPHQLRHSVATMLIASNESIPDVARYLGDAVTTVVSTYLHASGSDPSKKIDKLLGGRTVGTKKHSPAKKA